LCVPQDVSVIGVDDHDLSRLFDLTTVAQPVREQGRVAARLLIEQLLAAGDRAGGGDRDGADPPRRPRDDGATARLT
jgi:DNA-binding LacI/PurR family transcriptional regulator